MNNTPQINEILKTSEKAVIHVLGRQSDQVGGFVTFQTIAMGEEVGDFDGLRDVMRRKVEELYDENLFLRYHTLKDSDSDEFFDVRQKLYELYINVNQAYWTHHDAMDEYFELNEIVPSIERVVEMILSQ